MRRRGFMFADALLGMVILGVAAALLVAAVNGSHRAGRTIDGHRRALRTASETLLMLQTRTQTGWPPDVTISDLDTPAATGWRWVTIRVEGDHGSAELVGLIPGRPR